MNSNINDEIRNNVVQKLDNIIGLKVVSRLIEKSIYNYTIHLAKEKNIKRNWENLIFRGLYFSKIRSIYSNLDKESYIGNDTFLDRILNKLGLFHKRNSKARELSGGMKRRIQIAKALVHDPPIIILE